MLIVHVHVRVWADYVDSFLTATLANAQASLQESGVLRFDVLHDDADAAHFVLVEVYKEADAATAHKETAHYAAWRDAVADMMAVPRESTRYAAAFPTEQAQWASPST